MITIDKGIVSRWKIDTHFENWLGHQADHSHFFKTLYCRYYAVFDKKYYVKGMQMAKKELALFHADQIFGSRYNEKKVLQDMIYCLHRFGFSYAEYFWYRLYDLNTDGKNEFISDKMRYEYYHYLNGEEGVKFLRDKGKTYELFKDFFKRDCVIVRSENDLSMFQEFAEKHLKFICKPIDSDSGSAVKIIDGSDHDAERLCKDLLKGGAFIAEEIIQQSEDLGGFHEQSVNTARIITMNCKDGVHVLFSIFRIGMGDSAVDNCGAGGICASVDYKSGIVVTKGVLETSDDQYICHPDSGKQILGFQMPEWEQAIQLVKSMAGIIPNIKYVGWDLAHTDHGWILVEANGSAMFGCQRAEKKGIRHRFSELMEKC